MKILIVDDEKRTLNGILNALDWNSYGIDTIQTASNGAAALEICKTFAPDIVLTDINMPKMNGIELSQKIKEILPDTKVAFISGYMDLQYMKSAFKNDVVDYIFKPINISELEQTISKITNIITVKKQKSSYLQKIESQLHFSFPVLRDKFFFNLVTKDDLNRSQIADKLQFLELDFDVDDYYSVFVIRSDNRSITGKHLTSLNGNLLSVAITNISLEILEHHGKGCCFESAEDEIACLVCFGSEENVSSSTVVVEERLEAIAADIHSSVNNALDLSITIGIGEWVKGLDRASYSYGCAKRALARRFQLGNNRIIYADSSSAHSISYQYVNYTDYQKIFSALSDCNLALALETVNKIFDLYSSSSDISRPQVVYSCMQMISNANGAIIENVGSTNEIIIILGETNARLQRCGTLEEMKEVVTRYCQYAVECISESNKRDESELIQRIRNYIKENYAKNITLQSLAKEVYLSPAYICLLFKQETDETVINYLTEVRMDQAKSLLRRKDLRISSVGEEVGYTDPKYFSRIFKKFTGQTPSEYHANFAK